MELFFVGLRDCEQINLLRNIADKFLIKNQQIEYDCDNIGFSIFSTDQEKQVVSDEFEIMENSIFYLHNVNYEFPFIPKKERYLSHRSYQDTYIAQQQKDSHWFSLLSWISDNRLITNNFAASKDILSKLDILDWLSDKTEIPNHIMTNKIDLMNLEGDDFLWSYPDLKAPFREIETKGLEELFNCLNDIPLVLCERKEGFYFRSYLYDDETLLTAIVKKPYQKGNEVKLEQFHYFTEETPIKDLSAEFSKEFNIKFFEVYGIIDKEDNFWIYGIDIDPDFMLLGEKGKEFLASRLIQKMILEQNPEKEFDEIVLEAKTEERETVFLTKMLEPFFEAGLK